MISLRLKTALGLVCASSLVVVAACGDDGTTSTTTSSSSTGGGGTGGSGGAGGNDVGVVIPGLTSPVSAAYDQNGILHLSCATDDDCFSALGYFHAQNRFFFMDFVRNLVRGKLANLVKAGDLVLEKDYANRQWFSTAEGEPLEKKLYDDASPAVKGHLDSYTRGVNAWIGDMRAGKHGATLTSEYDFALIVKENIRDWEPEDSAAVGLYVLDDLSNNSGGELDLGAQVPAYDPALAADLFSPVPVFDAFTVTSSNAAPPSGVAGPSDALADFAPLFAAAHTRLDLVGGGRELRNPGDIGSNNWAVAPSRTTAGNALLANDPHLSLTNPSIWFPVEIDAKSDGNGTFHTAGSTFPGLPSTMVGHNESIGWGVTTAYWDLADVYLENESVDGTTVSFNGADVPIVEKTFTFDDAKTATKIDKTFRWVPHHGPIMSEDPATHTAVTIRWRGHEGGRDLDAFFDIGTSSTVGEAKAALEANASSSSQNFLFVDKTGDIGWYPFAKVPGRSWATQSLPPWMPLPGDGSAEWEAPVPFASLPQLTNPPAGVIATANADMTGASADGDTLNDGQAAIQAIDKAEGTRIQRILDRLETGLNAHTPDTMHDIQGDDYSLYGEIVVPTVLAAAGNATLSANQQAVIDALTGWDYTCPTGLDGTDPATSPDSTDPVAAKASIGCSAFHATLFAIVQDALGDEIEASGAGLSGRWNLHLVVRALKDPLSISSGDMMWDDVSTTGTVETKDEILLKAVEDAGTALAVTGQPNDWRWGRIHTLSLRSIYDSFGVATYNIGPFAAAGGQYTVNVASPNARSIPADGKPWDFAFSAGPSVRFVIEATPSGPHMTYELPGGADLHTDSPFFNNLLPNWLANKPIDFPFGLGAVPNPAKTVVVFPG